MTYLHKEAFALMWYGCPCGHRERIWNSRDGVTPFGGIRCSSCGSAANQGVGLTHIWFQADQCAPDHKLIDGQLFFRDGTTFDAISIIKRRIRLFADRGQPIPENIAGILLEDARNQPRGEWSPGWPTVDRYNSSNKAMVEKYRGASEP